MPRIVKILLVVGAGLVLAALLVYVIFSGGIPTETEPANENGTPTEPAAPAEPGPGLPDDGQDAEPARPAVPTMPEISEEERELQLARRALETIAFGFAERYGSYSNESDFSNIEDLYDVMTSGMRARSESLVRRLRSESQGQTVYKGYSARALSSDFRSFDQDAGRAQVAVTTQREESIGSPGNTRIYYQDLLLSFQKEGGVWLVDNAIWQSERR